MSRAARYDASEARRMTVTCVESESRNAMRVIPHAVHHGKQQFVNSVSFMPDVVDVPNGCMARPRVHDAPTVCQLVLSALYTTVKYPWTIGKGLRYDRKEMKWTYSWDCSFSHRSSHTSSMTWTSS